MVRKSRLLEADSATRKTYPLATGLIDYFPDALAEVARVSYLGNEKHNPGEPMHHARGKSMDHPDCIARHLAERGGFDGEIRHSAALAWRALALLQEELEREHGLPLPRGARGAPAPLIYKTAVSETMKLRDFAMQGAPLVPDSALYVTTRAFTWPPTKADDLIPVWDGETPAQALTRHRRREAAMAANSLDTRPSEIA